MAVDYTTPAEALSEAGTLFSGLIAGLPAIPALGSPPTVTIPEVGTVPTDLSEAVTQPSVDDLTSGAVAGTGVFDKIMSSLSTHIESQYKKNLIGQSDVATVYIAAIQAVLPQAVQFLLSNEQSYWQAKLVQIQAQNAYLERAKLVAEVETAKLMAYRAQAEAYTAQVASLTAQTAYANGKMQLVLTQQQINTLEAQQAVNEANHDEAYVKTRDTLPGGGTPAGHTGRDFDLKEAALVTATKQQNLLDAQVNVQRAQTYDTNTDLTAVAGVIGVQKSLYQQQIQSYQLDGKNKGVKLLADLWTSAKALDDTVQSPGPLAGNLMIAANKYMNDLGLPNAAVSADTPATGAPSQDTDWNTPGDQ
jgi:hypothetical protein